MPKSEITLAWSSGVGDPRRCTDYVNIISVLVTRNPDEKIVRFDIPVDQRLFVDGLDASNLETVVRCSRDNK